MRIRTGLALILCLLGLLIGCDGDTSNGNQVTQVDTESQTVTQLANKDEGIVIPYKQLRYTKVSSDSTLEWSTEELPEEIIDKYGNYANSVPGGFMIQETPSEYFICVNFGKKESVTKGFKIQSFAMHNIDTERSYVRIHAVPVIREDGMDEKVKGEVSVRSFISVAKKDLPEGIGINEMILSVDKEM